MPLYRDPVHAATAHGAICFHQLQLDIPLSVAGIVGPAERALFERRKGRSTRVLGGAAYGELASAAVSPSFEAASTWWGRRRRMTGYLRELLGPGAAVAFQLLELSSVGAARLGTPTRRGWRGTARRQRSGPRQRVGSPGRFRLATRQLPKRHEQSSGSHGKTGAYPIFRSYTAAHMQPTQAPAALADTTEIVAALFVVAEVLALCSVPSVLLNRRGRPTAALAWLLALFALPALGGLLWWAFGRTRLERRKRRRGRMAAEFNQLKLGPVTHEGTVFDKFLPRRAIGTCVFPSTGNAVELLIDGKQAYPAMERAIAGSTESINALFYIWHADAAGHRLRDLLVEKAQQGVQVRVLVDAFGSDSFRGEFIAPLLDAGVKVGSFFPSAFDALGAPRFNFRNHRKILVVDGAVAFTGGMNIGDEYANDWRDLMVCLRGPAVSALSYVFLDDWYFATGESVDDQPTSISPNMAGSTDIAVIASGPDSEAWIHDAYFTALSRAESRIWIATPYFIPTAPLMAALRTAAGRDVEVGIVVPDVSDVRLVKWASRSYYKDLLDAGVKVYEYQGPMLHAKALLVDDSLVSVGTANLDTRSLRLSFEVGCFFASPALNRQLWEWFQDLRADSKSISREALRAAPTSRKLLESVAHLLSPLL